MNKEVEPEILTFAQAHSMKIMPLVTNTQFNKAFAHQFLSDTQAQMKAINRLLELCHANHFYGLQLDFEMIKLDDRDALSHFYELAADKLHNAGYKISFAVAPVVTDKPISLFYKKVFQNWEGAYDLKVLGKAGDFISIMAYNQHGGSTTPGATASLEWVKQTVIYALQFVPANKISIGIAAYSTHWYTGQRKINGEEKIAVKMRGINHENAENIIKRNHVTLVWDRQAAVYYGIFVNNWLNEYIFLEDSHSFKKKLRLVKDYQLHGISVFDLGTEDPKIWEQI